MLSYYFLLEKLLVTYDKVLLLKVRVNSEDLVFKKMYINAAEKHNNKISDGQYYIDAGFDLIMPGYDIGSTEDTSYGGNSIRHFTNQSINKVDFKISCSAQIMTDNDKTFNTGYYMHPRSSLSKSPLRLANSTGIVDAGYTGNLIGMFDCHQYEYEVSKYDRLLQICAPGLIPIVVEMVDSNCSIETETERGAGGFGSTGN
jgi:dUTP pyrophosphatase